MKRDGFRVLLRTACGARQFIRIPELMPYFYLPIIPPLEFSLKVDFEPIYFDNRVFKYYGRSRLGRHEYREVPHPKERSGCRITPDVLSIIDNLKAESERLKRKLLETQRRNARLIVALLETP